jgi:hypothetical protein
MASVIESALVSGPRIEALLLVAQPLSQRE